MKALAVWKKEMKIAFASPMAYVLFVAFLLVSGWMFDVIVSYVVQSSLNAFSPTSFSLMDAVFRPLYRNMAVILIFLAPAITMRLFSEEKRAGSIELLFTYPLTDLDILIGKFLSALTMLAFIFVPTISYAIFIQHFSPVEWRVLGLQYLGFFLLGASCIAVGLWASNMTESQIVAYVVTFVILLFLWVITWVKQSFPTSKAAEVLSQCSILQHFDSFTQGVLSSNDLVFYVLFVVFFLYLTLKGLESRAWQGAKE